MIDKIKRLFRFNTPVLPTAYSESLSYYEDIQLLINKIDECVDAINNFVVPDGSSTPIADNIAKYDEGGRLKTNEPSTDLDCVNLKYFNENNTGSPVRTFTIEDPDTFDWIGADFFGEDTGYKGELEFMHLIFPNNNLLPIDLPTELEEIGFDYATTSINDIYCYVTKIAYGTYGKYVKINIEFYGKRYYVDIHYLAGEYVSGLPMHGPSGRWLLSSEG